MTIVYSGDQITFPDGTEISSYPDSGFKNKLIGGDFSTNPWQRGTSFTALANAGYGADRWLVGHSSDAVVDIKRTADAPTAAQAGVFTRHCLHADVTTADTSIGVAQTYQIIQRIEGQNIMCAGFGQPGTRYVTLSFWVSATVTGVYCVALGNSATDRSYVAEYTVNASNIWEKKSITIPVDTAGTWLYDTNIGLQIRFVLAAGTDRITTANTWQAGNLVATVNQVNALNSVTNDFKIALVQLEMGSVATRFEARSIGTELQLCQRYYYRDKTTTANDVLGALGCYSTTQAFSYSKFPVSMRTNPTVVEQSGTAGDYGILTNGGTYPLTVVPAFRAASVNNYSVLCTVGGSLISGGGGCLVGQTTAAYLGWSAEL